MRRINLLLALCSAPALLLAQMSSSVGGTSVGQTGTSNSSSGTVTSNGQTQRNPADNITAVAPPFDVDDVIRMHRVGLQDEVIINALRARYHPLKLTPSERALLKKHNLSDAVIAAIENPWGTEPLPDQAGEPAHDSAHDNGRACPAAAPAAVHAAGEGSCSNPARKDTAVNSVTAVPAAANATQKPGLKITHALPAEPGVYRQIAGVGWSPVPFENVTWDHDPDVPTRHVAGHIPGAASPMGTRPLNTDFLIVTSKAVSIVQFQLLHMRQIKEQKQFEREVRPTIGGDAFGGESNPDIVFYSPLELSPTVWMVSLTGLKRGEYGFLPPLTETPHSTTGMSDGIYTFHVF